MIPKAFWKALLAVNLATILFYWWQGSSSLLSGSLAEISIAFGRFAGLSAGLTVLLQFMFMGRLPWLERSFGLDKLARIHRANGKLSLCFILAHPVLLTFGYSRLTGISLLSQLQSFLFDYEHVLWAGLGVLLFIIVVVSSLVIIRQRLRYEAWYFVHLIVYAAVFASFWHQIRIGGDLLASEVFYWYWIGLYVAVFVSHLLFRFLRPLYLFNRHHFQVARVVRENHNTVSVYITGKNLRAFTIYPGQFMILRFLTKGMWWQAHPFSLSFVPLGQELRITVKELGDFTKQVGNISVGTKIIIDGPYGVFTEWVSASPKVLFIAGGIGITPVRSLMEAMLKKQKDTVLLYANKTEKDIVFKDELASLAQKTPAKVINILSEEPNYQGEKGVLDAERIQKLVPDVSSREVFLCGPARMMDAMITALQSVGVPRSHIHYEKFAL